MPVSQSQLNSIKKYRLTHLEKVQEITRKSAKKYYDKLKTLDVDKYENKKFQSLLRYYKSLEDDKKMKSLERLKNKDFEKYSLILNSLN